MEQPIFGFGAEHSKKDYRTLQHADMARIIAPTGGITYDPAKDLLNQRKVGICTAISLVQNVNIVKEKRYSEDFQYLLQKKFFDRNWSEGSSIFYALKAGVKYGFLPIEDWVYTSEADHDLPYQQYIAKLQAIPDSEIQRLLLLCEKPLRGYSKVDVSTAQSFATAIAGSIAGILCRYDTGETWYLPSWKPEDINPIKFPNPITGGHAITASYYDMTGQKMSTEHPNTWGGIVTPTWEKAWDRNGLCDILYEDYKPTEAWMPIFSSTPTIVNRPSLPPHQLLTKNLYFGMQDDQIKMIQHVLSVLPESGWFGTKTLKAVIAYQKSKNITPAVGFIGIKTRQALNGDFFN